MSRLRRPFLSDRYFFLTVRLLKERAKLTEADFQLLALAVNRARVKHRFLGQRGSSYPITGMPSARRPIRSLSHWL